MRRKLPTGIQTFREMREDGCYYVDETPHIEQLVDRGKYYFLSRPCRFGKSLLVDALEELFEGNEALFRGLHIHGRWDWSVRHPVVKSSFGGAGFRAPGSLHTNLTEQLDRLERLARITPRYATLCGYTDADPDTVFTPELDGLDRDARNLAAFETAPARAGGLRPHRTPGHAS